MASNITYTTDAEENIPVRRQAYKVELTDIAPDSEEKPLYPITRAKDCIYLTSREWTGILKNNESVARNMEYLEGEIIGLQQQIDKLQEEIIKK